MMRINNGHVIDPLNGINRVCDVLVDGDKIVKVGAVTENAGNVIDATGCYVVPGFIDHHCHLSPFVKIGLPAETVCFTGGVTTAVDAGSNGCATYEKHRTFINQAKLGIKCYLHVSSQGLTSLPVLEDVDPTMWDEGALKDMFQKYPDELVGLKLRTSAPIVKEWGWTPLIKTVELAEKIGVSVMVHCTDPPGEMSDLVKELRPGDVMTHTYMNKGSSIIENGHVKDCVWAARERGVLFECSDAREHFGMPVAEAAIADGFYPDLLGTDVTALSMHLRPTAFNFAMQVSKYTDLGIPFEKVIEIATVNNARQLGILDKAGSLTPGNPADLVVLQPIETNNIFGDRPYGNPDQVRRLGKKIYKPMLTLKNGQMVYRDMLF